jgi:hypothetical protein
VVVAVVIGLFLLRNGLDTSEAVSTDPGDQGSEPSDSGDGTDEGGDEGTDGTTSSTVAARAPAEVPTIVLNDSGVSGAAKKYSDALAAADYQLTNPDGANADTEGDAATTIVYFVAGFETEAEAVRVAIGAPDTVAPQLLPAATPPGPIAGASVVVVIGLDLANVTPPVPGGGGSTSTTAAAN